VSEIIEAYYRVQTFEVHVAGVPVAYCSKPGLADWQEVRPAEHLLAEHAELPPGGRLLLLGCRHGALAAALSRRLSPGEFRVTDTSSIALELCRRTLALAGLPEARVFSPLDPEEPSPAVVDTCLIQLPKGRDLARRWLLEAWRALRPGGLLFLAGANQEGIQTAIKDAAGLFGGAAVMGFKKGSRVARLQKPEAGASPVPTWAGEAGIAPGTWIEFRAQTPLGAFELRSLPGVFSHDRLDPGSELLLQALARIPPAERVLDLGCGTGILGLAAARRGAGEVDLVDDNLLAVLCARENARWLGMERVRALPGDGVVPVEGQLYNLALSNPPFHAGKGVDYRAAQAFIAGARRVLAPGGRLVLVANRFIRYDRLLREVFESVEVLEENSRYHVLAGWAPVVARR